MNFAVCVSFIIISTLSHQVKSRLISDLPSFCSFSSSSHVSLRSTAFWESSGFLPWEPGQWM